LLAAQLFAISPHKLPLKQFCAPVVELVDTHR
jgi:hypothetical protein